MPYYCHEFWEYDVVTILLFSHTCRYLYAASTKKAQSKKWLYKVSQMSYMHVYPHITQYTVYITDNYTGNIIVKENATETRFPFKIQHDGQGL